MDPTSAPTETNPDGSARAKPPQEVLNEFERLANRGMPVAEAERTAWHNYASRNVEKLEESPLKEALRGVMMVLCFVPTVEDPVEEMIHELLTSLGHDTPREKLS